MLDTAFESDELGGWDLPMLCHRLRCHPIGGFNSIIYPHIRHYSRQHPLLLFPKISSSKATSSTKFWSSRFLNIHAIKSYATLAKVRLEPERSPPTNQSTPLHVAHPIPTRNLNLTMSHAVRYQADVEPPFCSLAVKDAFELVSLPFSNALIAI